MTQGPRRRWASSALLLALLASAPASALLVPVTAPLPCDALVATAGYEVTSDVCGRWDRIPDLPAPREGLMLAFARSGGPVPGWALAFGGVGPDGLVKGDLYSYQTGSPWHARAPGPARADGVFVFDDLRGRGFLFGGRDDQGRLGDLWEYQFVNDTWVQRATPPGPSPRYGAVGAWDPVTSRMLVFGGGGEFEGTGDVWVYDPQADTWTLGANAPAARIFAGGAWDVVRRGLLIHGGFGNDGFELADTWLYTPANDQWKVQTPGPFAGRARFGATWWPQRTNLLVFGGSVEGQATADTFVFGAEGDFGQPFATPPLGLWVQQASLPSPRVGSAATWEVGIGIAFVVGGRTASGPTAEAWSFFPSTATAPV